ncbi:glycosyltransferase family 2 protein [Arthrobacter sp. 2MCAF15]|uniref:glycosyltransferase family 2 protein n=1 Tax=Arthrobacter sp. 2MCAF15 TaxID=3232984 RepID=UPI003F90ED5A
MGKSPVSVWIVNYNSSQYLEKCLSSLMCEPIDAIFVLDNGSDADDKIAAMELVSRVENATFLTADVNLGFGGGMNEVSRSYNHASPDEVIWLLNPDCEVEPGTTLKLLEALEAFDIVSPLITNGAAPDRKVWFAGGVLDPAKGACSHIGYGSRPEEFSTGPSMPTMFLSGASIVMKRSAWDTLGGFREDLFLYWEDAELCIRATELSMKLGIVPQAQVWHREGGSSVSDGSLRSKTYYYYIARNRIIVCSAMAAKYDIVLGRGLVESLKLLGRPLLREKSGRIEKFLAAASGTLAGIFS